MTGIDASFHLFFTYLQSAVLSLLFALESANRPPLIMANDSLKLAGEVLASVSVRVRAGASPNVEVLRAEAAQGQPQFSRVEALLFKLAQAGNFDNLYTRAASNPSIG